MRYVVTWLVSTVSLVMVAYFIPGIKFDSFSAVLWAAIILGIINAIIRPLILILTLPINVLTLGIFTFFINALMLWLVHYIVHGFEIVSFASAFWGALIYWIINWVINLMFNNK